MPEFDANSRSIGLAVITFYPKWYSGKLRSIKHTDKVRGDLAIEFFKLAAKFRYQVVCVDGKSAKTFKNELSNIPGIKVIRRRTMKRSPSKRIAIKMASKLEGIKVIVLTEAEKISLLDSLLQIAAPILHDKADIVIPRREDRLFKQTYPNYMYESEVEGNRIFNEALLSRGLLTKEMAGLDSFFGPRAFANDPKIISFFTKQFTYRIGKTALPHQFFDPEEYSNVQFFPIVQALQKRVRVKSVEIPFSYPVIQKENEQIGAHSFFREKRNMQRMGILVNLVHFLSYLEKRKASGMRISK